MAGFTEEDIRNGRVTFIRTLRGYDPAVVDPLLREAERVALGGDSQAKAAMAQRLHDTDLQVVWRGYDRAMVGIYIEALVKDYLLQPET